jgi:hypothetical protein
MKYFAHVDENNILKGWYTTDLHKNIPEPSIEISQSQWQEALDGGYNKIENDGTCSFVNILTLEELEAECRSVRGSIFSEVVDPIVSNPLRWAELTETEKQEVADYRLALLAITSQESFPQEVSWPVMPEFLV